MEQYQRDEDFVPVVYSEDEKAFLTKIKSEMENARNVRDEAHVEFDDMSYLKFYEFNAKAGNGYIAPKANKEDVRTTTGTTLEKKNTLMSNILNLNLDPAINAYEKSNIHVTEIGDTMASMVKKSWNMERPIFDVKEVQILDELLTQGTVFVKDELISFKLPVKTVKSMDFSDMKKIEWNESMGKVTEMMNTRLLSGPNVYLGNFSEPYMQLQPYVVVRTVLSRSEARAIYGDWDRWKNVPHKFESDNDDKAYNNWTLEEYHDDYVEVLEYMNKWDNNYMVLLNGTMMFPVKFQDRMLSTFPLSSINGVNEYPIAKGILEPITNCAYGRSIPAKTKVDQATFDEMVRLMILKTRQSFMPPMANNTGQTLSKSIFYPAAITDDIAPDQLYPIIPATGVTNSEFAMVNFIKGIIDAKSVSSTFQGQESPGKQTATEISIQQRQSMMNIGLSVGGWVNLKRDLLQLRIYNIISNWVFEGNKIEMDAEFENGQQGQQIVDFREEMPTTEQLQAEEELLEILKGGKHRKQVISPKILKEMDLMWDIQIVPTPKDTTELRRAQFEDGVAKAYQIFAPFGKMPNADYLGERWAVLGGEDPEKYWMPAQPAMPMGAMGDPAMATGGMQPQMAPKPSVNTLQSQ